MRAAGPDRHRPGALVDAGRRTRGARCHGAPQPGAADRARRAGRAVERRPIHRSGSPPHQLVRSARGVPRRVVHAAAAARGRIPAAAAPDQSAGRARSRGAAARSRLPERALRHRVRRRGVPRCPRRRGGRSAAPRRGGPPMGVDHPARSQGGGGGPGDRPVRTASAFSKAAIHAALARHACRADSSCQAPGIGGFAVGGRSASASTSRAIAIASWVSLLARVRRRRLSAVRRRDPARHTPTPPEPWRPAPQPCRALHPDPGQRHPPDQPPPTPRSRPRHANEADATSPPTPLSTATVADRLCGSIPATAPPT